MACENETARQLTAMWVEQVTPYYAVTVVAALALGAVAIGMVRGRVTAPPLIRAIVTVSLGCIVIYGAWRVGYDRGYMRELRAMACGSVPAR